MSLLYYFFLTLFLTQSIFTNILFLIPSYQKKNLTEAKVINLYVTELENVISWVWGHLLVEKSK